MCPCSNVTTEKPAAEKMLGRNRARRASADDQHIDDFIPSRSPRGGLASGRHVFLLYGPRRFELPLRRRPCYFGVGLKIGPRSITCCSMPLVTYSGVASGSAGPALLSRITDQVSHLGLM